MSTKHYDPIKIFYVDKKQHINGAKILAFKERLVEIISTFDVARSIRHVYYKARGLGLLDSVSCGYEKVQKNINELRDAGSIDDDLIEDTSRRFVDGTGWRDIQSFKDVVLNSYKRNLWNDQQHDLQIWCESESISSAVNSVVVDDWRSVLYICKGFPSRSYIKKGAKRIQSRDRKTIILILTDFDPNGCLIAQKVQEGLEEFVGDSVPLEFKRIGLTKQQTIDYNLPQRELGKEDRVESDNKKGVSIPQQFINYFNVEYAVDLEALDSDLLQQIVSDEIEFYVDKKQWSDSLDREVNDLQQLSDLWKSVT